MIEHIQARTLAGFDKNNDKFVKYKKKYADEKGVGVNDVDLTLSGEMLDNLEVIKTTPDSITIGYKNPDDELAGKVEGNRRGTYGQPSPVTKPRDFMGIERDELEILIDSYEDFDQEELSDAEVEEIARNLAEDLLDGT